MSLKVVVSLGYFVSLAVKMQIFSFCFQIVMICTVFHCFFLAQVEVHVFPGSSAGGIDGQKKVKGNCLA